jgi:hypothetical protein
MRTKRGLRWWKAWKVERCYEHTTSPTTKQPLVNRRPEVEGKGLARWQGPRYVSAGRRLSVAAPAAVWLVPGNRKWILCSSGVWLPTTAEDLLTRSRVCRVALPLQLQVEEKILDLWLMSIAKTEPWLKNVVALKTHVQFLTDFQLNS